MLRIARKPSSSRPGLADNIRVVRPWGRWKRRLVAERLLHMALLEIRFLAANPSDADHPDGPLAQIHMIADVCHRLPVSPLGRDKEGFDPFVYMWQTASPDQQHWLTEQLQAIGVDQRYLEESPPWPPPATPPAVRPRWGRHGWQLPRDPRAFKALDTTTLRALILEADALEPPGRKHPNWLLAHLHPDGPHILRASRTHEILFLPQGPADLRQYRCLVWMEDSTTVVGHVRLRVSSFTALPANLSRLQRPHSLWPLRLLHGRETKKGRYVYYHCTGYWGKCPEPYAREEVIERQFADLLRGLSLEPDVLAWVTKALRESQRDEKRFHEQAVARLQAESALLDKRLEEMYLDKLDGRVSAAFYDRKSTEWGGEQERLLAATEDHRQANRLTSTQAFGSWSWPAAPTNCS